MFTVEIYAAVRRFVFVDGNSRREAARVFGLNRETVAKLCRFSLPPGYTRTKPVGKPKLGPLLPVIDAILKADQTAPVKQRHTAKRIFARLRDEHGFGGGYTVVKDHVRLCRAQGREMFVPLAHPPGHAQVDFGEAVGVIGGDGKRERTRAFTELVSHYLFADRFGRPGKGNDKGKVEGLVKFSRANFMVPIPHAASFDALNAYLEERCRARQSAARLDLAAYPHLPKMNVQTTRAADYAALVPGLAA